jgi:metal-responsive CopG/Arc/MetJ family transcriptional regulator
VQVVERADRGRPPGPERQRINLTLPPGLVARADAEAARLGIDRSRLVERALGHWLADPPDA